MSTRSAEGRLFFGTIADLTAHVGGKPTPVQRELINRLAWLAVHLSMFDRDMVETGQLSARNSKQYLAWSNTQRLLLRELDSMGVEPAKPVNALADYLAARGGREVAA